MKLPTDEQLDMLASPARGPWTVEVDNGAETVGLAGLNKGSASRVARAARRMNPGARVRVFRPQPAGVSR